MVESGRWKVERIVVYGLSFIVYGLWFIVYGRQW